MFAGDTVKFAWSGAHDVNLMNSCDGGPAGAQRWDAFACPTNTNDATEIGSTSPASYQIPASSYKDGAYLCFFCSLAGHCGAGMHLTVKIKGGPPCNYDDLTIPPGVVARPPHSVPPLAPKLISETKTTLKLSRNSKSKRGVPCVCVSLSLHINQKSEKSGEWSGDEYGSGGHKADAEIKFVARLLFSTYRYFFPVHKRSDPLLREDSRGLSHSYTLLVNLVRSGERII
jgi:hypothetical protein